MLLQRCILFLLEFRKQNVTNIPGIPQPAAIMNAPPQATAGAITNNGGGNHNESSQRTMEEV